MQFTQLGCVEGELFWAISESNFFQEAILSQQS